MRRLLVILLVVATAAFAGIALDTSSRYELNNCASGGGDGGIAYTASPTEGQYLFRVTGADTWVCIAATCASGGELFASGTIFLWQVPRGGQTVSCRSSASTGNAIWTRAN